MKLLTIKDLELAGRKVFIRCDFNVPLDEFGNITDDRRIRAALQTIRYCLDHECAIILASHMGRPKGEFNEKYSLKPVAKRLQSLLHQDVALAKDVVGPDATARAKELNSGEILLLENVRFEPGETKNDPALAEKMASMAEFYINDAFGVSHRAHASVEAITHYFDNRHKGPTRPFMAIVGGSKVSGKLEALINLLPKVDKMVIGGAMAFTFWKARGYGGGAPHYG